VGLASDFEAVIGLEIHAQLLTRTKLFCGCPNRFGDRPNTNVCPVCLGLPGALPVLNRQAVELALRMARAVSCTINPVSIFARKNYFYPDLPKGYQISQYNEPLASGGEVPFLVEGRERLVRLTRIHLEEDAGKLLHEGFPQAERKSGVDFNRSGTPLIEIVSEPDLRSPAEASAYAQAIKTILEYTEVSDGNMEEGSLRCDANVSVRRPGEPLGVKVEIKNLNSFRHLSRALGFEMDRQSEAIESGEPIVQETRLFDPRTHRTEPMRSKEEAHDYRYFPEPDLPPLRVSREWSERVRSSLPELPAARSHRIVTEYALPPYDAAVLTSTRGLADYFEAAARASGEPKATSNWIMTEVLRKTKETGAPIRAFPVTPEKLAELLRLIESGVISGKIAKGVFESMCQRGDSASAIIEREGLTQVTDRASVQAAARRVVAAHPGPVAEFRQGKKKTFGFLVGQLMKETGGKANPRLAGEVLEEMLRSDSASDTRSTPSVS
jgi:aspartyl-tRNA(Asn)/glutamyl-tRNA(Gln) amidotransferase subunit B